MPVKKSKPSLKKIKVNAYKKVDVVEVFIWNEKVGAIALDPSLGFYVFAYRKNFGKSGIELSPLHMPLNQTETPFAFTRLPEKTYQRLPALFADALPDDFGNALIDSYMAQKGISKDQITPLDRLAYMGKRAMGALEFKPVRGPELKTATSLELDRLVTEARRVLQGKFNDEQETNLTLKNLIAVGTSAGGARAKAVIGWNPKTKEVRSGQIDLPEDFEHWLLKFDGVGEDQELGSSQNYGRIEYAYALMAKKAGIEMSLCELLTENGRAHFMTKRFDREKGNIKHHIQTLCGMDHVDYKKKETNAYEQLLMAIRKLGMGHEAEVEAFRRMVFNVLTCNCDDHSKNFSFILKQGGAWDLAPAYDLTFAHNPKGEWTHQHLMSVNGKFKDITKKDFLSVADRFGVGEAKFVIDEVSAALELWPKFAKEAGLSSKAIKNIQKLHELL